MCEQHQINCDLTRCVFFLEEWFVEDRIRRGKGLSGE